MIYTFYSYKGGVGRSMALANVAKWYYLRGLRVVMIDWDLEAPGLENFLYKQQDQLEKVRSQLGLIDMLLAYKRQFPLLFRP
jgi:MinD-like ATPase involved in chromosome partitioning or flagellar assembly